MIEILKKIGLCAAVSMVFFASFLGTSLIMPGDDPIDSASEFIPEPVQIASFTPMPIITQPETKEPSITLPGFEIVDQKKYDSRSKTQVELHIVISGTITESGIRQLLMNMYYIGVAERGFKNHDGKPTHVVVRAYSSVDHYKSGATKQIASLFRIVKNDEFDVKIDTEAISQLDKEPETTHGLSESKRREIFKEKVASEDRADAEVKQLFPDDLMYSNETFKKQDKARHALYEKYKKEIINRYKITEEILFEIKVEAMEEDWPLPPISHK